MPLFSILANSKLGVILAMYSNIISTLVFASIKSSQARLQFGSGRWKPKSGHRAERDILINSDHFADADLDEALEIMMGFHSP